MKQQSIIVKKNPTTYFNLIQMVGKSGPYQRNIFFIFFLNWFICALLINQTTFLFMNKPFDCKKQGLLVQDCEKFVCSLPQEEWQTFFEEDYDRTSLATMYGPYVCSNSSTADFFKAVIFIGIFIGYPVVLWFADNYGRKLSVMISWGITVFGCAMLSFSQNIEMALVGLLCSGAGSEAAIRVSMVSFAEVVDFYKRQKYSVALEISFGIAGVLIGGLYYVIHNWRTINIFIIFLLSVIEYVFFIFYFQETPKYAIKKGIEYGVKSLNFVGEANKGKKNIIKEQHIQQVLQEESDNLGTFNKVTPLDIFLFPSLRTKSICCCMLMFLINYLYWGPLFIVGKIGLNPYINQAVVGSSELVGYPLSFLLVKRMPRISSGIVCYCISVFFTTLLIFVEKPEDCDGCFQSILELICVFGSRTAVAFYYAIFFLYVTELFPVPVRGMGFGIASAVGALSSISAPIIFGFFENNSINPMIFETVVGVFSIIFLFFLPQTHNKPLSQQVQQIKDLKEKIKAASKINDEENEALSQEQLS